MSKVSVILPVYNGDCFVGKAIESVLSQTWSDWELIAINDGSTDNTQSILESFTDERITIATQANSGEAAARNAGLELAKGDYVVFLDADDFYYDNAFSDLIDLFEKNENAGVIYADGHVLKETNNTLRRIRDLRSGIYTGNILEQLVLSSDVVSFPVSTMTRRTVIEQYDLRFDVSLGFGTDWDFWIQLARFVTFEYLDRLVCVYRIHGANMTLTTNSQQQKVDLLKGRMKILNSSWFIDLSPLTRSKFFHHLCLGLLVDHPEHQQTIFQTEAFLCLPVNLQAQILRRLASNHIIRGKNIQFAQECLDMSLEIQPWNLKSRLLLWLVELDPEICKRYLIVWQHVHETMSSLILFGRRTPESVASPIEA